MNMDRGPTGAGDSLPHRDSAYSATDDRRPTQGNETLPDLPPTARRILQAALELLSSEGYSAMSLQRVARKAGVNKSTVIYTFGNKAGLLSSVVDAQVHDINARLSSLTAADPTANLDIAIQGMTELVEATGHLKGYFDILPHAFRDPELRERLWNLYKQWFDEYLRWFGLSRNDYRGDQQELVLGLAQLIVAIPDGLSIQAELGQTEFEVRRPLAALQLLLESAIGQLKAEGR